MSKTWKILTVVLLALVVAQGAGLFYLWQSGQESQTKYAEAAARLAAARSIAPPVARPVETGRAGSPNPPNDGALGDRALPDRALPEPVASVSTAPTPPPQYLPRHVQPMPGTGQALSRSSARNSNALRAERARRVQQKMQELTANGRKPSPAELDPLLQELVEIQGTSNIGGVNLQALRDNLKVADRMQTLAKELEAEIKKPQPERDMAKVKSIQEAILREQQGLRLDFMAGAQPPMMPPMPTLPAQPAPQPPAGQ
ncbi:hypothetical protein AGMMS50256_19830 [Betaproteobacteria bacterium]|nr:hypothetical protein AGMMS50256_19830 [Betaproteobacteria bacterium]